MAQHKFKKLPVKSKVQIPPMTEPDDARTMIERIDDLGAAIIENGSYHIDRLLKKGIPIPPDEFEKQCQMQQQFRLMTTTVLALQRMNRIDSKPNANFDKQFLQKIKERKSSVGDIVREIPNEKLNGI